MMENNQYNTALSTYCGDDSTKQNSTRITPRQPACRQTTTTTNNTPMRSRLNINKDSIELDTFIACANIAYPDWEINGDATADITKDNIEIIQLKTYHGRCGPQRYGDGIRIGLNKRRMKHWPAGKAIGLIIHELAHVKHTDHSKAFWELVIRIYHSIAPRLDEIEDVYGRDIDQDVLEKYLIHNPKMRTVDGRQETPYHRRLLIAKEFNRENEVSPFDGNQFFNRAAQSIHSDADPCVVSLDDLAHPDDLPSVEEVAEWLAPQRRNTGISVETNPKFSLKGGGVRMGNGKRFVVTEPFVINTDHGYDFADTDSRYRYATLLYDSNDDSPAIDCGTMK